MTPATRRLLLPGLMTLTMALVMAGLGTWQVSRLLWKSAILADIARAESAPPAPLGDRPAPFAKVSVTGRFHHDRAALYGAEVRQTPTGPEMGGRLIVALAPASGDPILVDRGWVPEKRRQPTSQPDGPVTVTGYVHPADTAGLFAAPDDPVGRRFFTLNPQTIGAALDLPRVAPYVIVAMGTVPAGDWPEPARTLPRPPNNHLAYVITWYGLAVAVVAVFVIWARKGSRA